MTWLLTYLGFFVAGLAGSLHCIGRCGPILTAVAGVDRTPVTVGGRDVSRAARRAAADLLWYHAGRICTYATLGAIAGLLGARLRDAVWLGAAQAWIGVVLGGAAVLVSFALLVKPATSCSTILDGTHRGRSIARVIAFLRSLAQQNTPSARFLLGSIMGFVPCGLVYIMLSAVAVTANPLAAALGMVAFGLGTLPALTGVVLALRLIPVRWRRHGNRVAMLVAIVVGSMFLWRSWPALAHSRTALDQHACPMCDNSGSAIPTIETRESN